MRVEKSKIYGRDRISQTLVKVTKRPWSDFRQSLILLLRFFHSKSLRLCNHYCFKSAKCGHESYLQTTFPATRRSGVNYSGTVAFISQLKMGRQVIRPALVPLLSNFPFRTLFRWWTPFYLFVVVVVSRTHLRITLPCRELLRTSLSQSLLSWSPSLTLVPLVAALSTHYSRAVFSQHCIPYEPGAFALAALCLKVCYLGSHTVVVQPRAKGANTIRGYYH